MDFGSGKGEGRRILVVSAARPRSKCADINKIFCTYSRNIMKNNKILAQKKPPPIKTGAGMKFALQGIRNPLPVLLPSPCNLPRIREPRSPRR